MVTVTTYNVYVSGTLDNEQFSGDIDPVTKNITIQPHGAAMISIELAELKDATGGPVIFADPPLSFAGGTRQEFICWALLSPTRLQVGDINYNKTQVSFTLLTNPSGLSDPTIVNTYQPPPLPGHGERRHERHDHPGHHEYHEHHEDHERHAKPAPAAPRRVA